MNNNQQFILEVCRFVSPIPERLKQLMQTALDYSYILGQLLSNRMGAVAYYVLEKCHLLSGLNREFKNSLEAIYYASTIQANSFFSALSILSHDLKSAAFQYALLKGAYLVDLYPVGLRTSNDIDILVSQSDLPKLTHLLIGSGFEQGSLVNNTFIPAKRTEIISSRMTRGETVPFFKKIDLPRMPYLELDINFSLDYKPIGTQNDVNLFLSRTVPVIQNGLYTLSFSDFVVHLCMHLYKEASILNWVKMGRDLSLYKFCDIYYLLTQYFTPDLYKALTDQIVKNCWEKECYYALYCTCKIFQIHDNQFNHMLDKIKPKNTDYINTIFDPGTKKSFRYYADICTWLFDNCRKEHLHEIKAEE